MTAPAIRLRHLAFHGPNKEPAEVQFGPGLNVIYGASNTGKSFILHAIDFMLGHKPPLPDIKERVGYDRVLLGVETTDGRLYTLQRSTDGAGFRLFEGLHTQADIQGEPMRELGDQHSQHDDDNISAFLLGLCGLRGKRVRRKRQETRSLSFRRLSHLILVSEEDIIERRSPLSNGNYADDPEHFATFKLLLTGVDDSALVTKSTRGAETDSREAQMELLDELIGDFRDSLSELTRDPDGLDDQVQRLEGSLLQQQEQLSIREASFRELADRRRTLRKKLEEAEDREAEVRSLVERFDLLDRHYASDIERLRGIEEGGSLFEVLTRGPCPLCGATPEHHNVRDECEANVGPVIEAARSEISKIDLLKRELAETRATLRREQNSFLRTIPRLGDELRTIAESVEGLSGPLARLRASYVELSDKRAEVRHAVSLRERLRDMERRRQELEASPQDAQESAGAEGDLPAAVAEDFAQTLEAILQSWHFPNAQRVYFDSKSRDIVIAGKPRNAYGKGLRAITHAAFTVGLMTYCREHDKPHPGFVVVDSPLLAYREPEGAEDDLTGVDLKEQFYSYLAALPDDRQVVVMENVDPPVVVRESPHSHFFSANPHQSRYGFFPLVQEEKSGNTVDEAREGS